MQRDRTLEERASPFGRHPNSSALFDLRGPNRRGPLCLQQTCLNTNRRHWSFDMHQVGARHGLLSVLDFETLPGHAQQRPPIQATVRRYSNLMGIPCAWVLLVHLPTRCPRPRKKGGHFGWPPQSNATKVGRSRRLPFHRALIRNHLAGDDIHVERDGAIAGCSHLNLVMSRRQAERLRRRRELAHGANQVAVHEQLRRVRRDVEAQTAGIGLV